MFSFHLVRFTCLFHLFILQHFCFTDWPHFHGPMDLLNLWMSDNLIPYELFCSYYHVQKKLLLKEVMMISVFYQTYMSSWILIVLVHWNNSTQKGLGVMVFNATLNNISVKSWWSVLLVEETRVPGENHRPAASHWQTLSHNIVSSTPRHERDSS